MQQTTTQRCSGLPAVSDFSDSSAVRNSPALLCLPNDSGVHLNLSYIGTRQYYRPHSHQNHNKTAKLIHFVEEYTSS